MPKSMHSEACQWGIEGVAGSGSAPILLNTIRTTILYPQLHSFLYEQSHISILQAE